MSKLILGFVVLLLTPQVFASAKDWSCERAETRSCEDLLSLEIKRVKVPNSQFSKYCKPNSKACAVISFKEKKCRIYFRRNSNVDQASLDHEVNHCYGWQHGKRYSKDWFVFPSLVKYFDKGEL
jgi:hypothetical protein